MCLNHSRLNQFLPPPRIPPHVCDKVNVPSWFSQGRLEPSRGASANPCSLPIVVTFPPIATILPPLGPVWWIIQTGPTVIALPLPSPLSGSSYLTIGVTVWTQRVDGG